MCEHAWNHWAFNVDLFEPNEILNKPGPAQVDAVPKVQQVVKFGGKSIMLYEKRKRYIRTFKASYPNFQNVISDFETLYRN